LSRDAMTKLYIKCDICGCLKQAEEVFADERKIDCYLVCGHVTVITGQYWIVSRQRDRS